jgi:drug/metabolite transporter (DMT)-like permease
MLSAGVFLVLLGAVAGEVTSVDASAFSLASVAAWLYLAVVGSLVGFTAYAWLLRNAPISKVVTHQYVNPLVAIVLGAVLLGEELTIPVLAGAALIVGSVFVAVRQERTPPAEPAPGAALAEASRSGRSPRRRGSTFDGSPHDEQSAQRSLVERG